MKKFIFYIQHFADPKTNVTTQTSLSPEMKEYYDTELLETVKEQLYFNQFGMVQELPEKKGKRIEFRKLENFNRVTKTLKEGVTPDGHGIEVESVSTDVKQYGDYTTVSDVLDMTAVDDLILAITDESAAQAALSLDSLTRHRIMQGGDAGAPHEIFADKIAADGTTTPVLTETAIGSDCPFTSKMVNKAVTQLKKNKAPKIDGKYICLIHPSVSEDLRESEGWIEAHKYASVTEIFNGEIGELHGVRFIETNEAPVMAGGADGGVLYYTLIFGKDAYARVNLEGGALEMIVKGLGEGEDPLNQRQTVGWKAHHGAELLYPERCIAVISGSSYSTTDEANYDPSVYVDLNETA